jgi:hypothetical protein
MSMTDEAMVRGVARLWRQAGSWRRLEASSTDSAMAGACCSPLKGAPLPVAGYRGTYQTYDLLRLGSRCPAVVRELAALLEDSGWTRIEIVGSPGRPPGGWCERADGSGINLTSMDGYWDQSWRQAALPAVPGRELTGERLRSVRGLRAMAWQLHVGLNVHGGWFPQQPTTVIPAHLNKLRQVLLEEEVRELAGAVAAGDITGIADALGDITYVAAGTALVYGIDLDLVMAAVHASNMTKVNVPGHDKLVKGDGYQPPAIGAALDRMRRHPRKLRHRWPLSLLDGRKFFS